MPRTCLRCSGWPNEDRLAVATLHRVFSEGDPDLLDQAVTPDWQDVPLAPQQPPGREGMKPLIKQFAAAFPDAEIMTHEVISEPGRTAVRAEVAGAHKGEWFGIAPTGRRFVVPMHEFRHVENGRLTRTWHLEDGSAG